MGTPPQRPDGVGPFQKTPKLTQHEPELAIRGVCSRNLRKEKWVGTGCFYFQEIIASQKKNEWLALIGSSCPAFSAKKKEAQLLTSVGWTETAGRSSKQKMKGLHKRRPQSRVQNLGDRAWAARPCNVLFESSSLKERHQILSQ